LTRFFLRERGGRDGRGDMAGGSIEEIEIGEIASMVEDSIKDMVKDSITKWAYLDLFRSFV
jgi:hypothetical protein